MMLGWDFELDTRSRFWRYLIKICVWTCDMTSRSYFGEMNSSLGSVVPLAMFMKSAVPNQTCRYEEKYKIFDQDCLSIGLVDLALPVKLLTSSPSSFACPYRSASTTDAIIVMIAVTPQDTFSITTAILSEIWRKFNQFPALTSPGPCGMAALGRRTLL